MKKYGVNELRQMFLDFMESKGPVSYTHLDVYKRQVNLCYYKKAP